MSVTEVVTSKPMGNYRRLHGHRNGRLVANNPVGRTKDGHIVWSCSCDCGQTVNIPANSLTRDVGTKSCGCLRRQVSSRPRAWNTGKTYPILDGEHIYRQRHAWAEAVISRNGNRCMECGWDKARCDADHIVPRSVGGQNTLANGRVLCPNCHRIKHTTKNP